jgi:hypothetical protein
MLILSLTSIPARVSTINLVINSILANTHLPELIVLNLYIEDFPNKENELPDELKYFLEEEIFEINWCNQDIKSYNKLLPTIQKYGFANDIITIDDDVIYPKNFISSFIKNKSKNTILCYRARQLRIYNGKFFPYNDSELIFFNPKLKPDYSYLFTAVGGAFYPAKSLNHNVLNYQLISDNFSHQDDIWFWINAISTGNKVKVIGLDNKLMTEKDYNANFITIKSTQSVSLWSYNSCGANDKALSNALILYPQLNKLVKNMNRLDFCFRLIKKFCFT